MIVQDSIHSTIPLYEQSFSDFNNIKLSTNKIVFIKVTELFLCTFLLLNKLMITKFKKYSNMADLFNEIFNDKSKSLKTKCVVLGISAKKNNIILSGCYTNNCDNICWVLHKKLWQHMLHVTQTTLSLHTVPFLTVSHGFLLMSFFSFAV